MQNKTYYAMYIDECIAEAELHEFFKRELRDAGYSGCSFRRAFNQVEITIKVGEPQIVWGENYERIHQIESVIALRLNLPLNAVSIFTDKIMFRGLSADILCDQLSAKLMDQVPIRQAAMSVIKSAMRAKAAGCQVIISGKLRQQRANSQKYKEGIIVTAGQPGKEFVDRAIRHIKMRQGVIGIQIQVFNPNARNQFGRVLVMPDYVEVL
ncbi:Ribosomal protein S3 [Spironucleus salmonicida]|uniref:40S ribosomal protein S3 n=1 Tax=Spironucleus salmonicida TaxID=348837 RepID=V6LAG7_9EUKA|nr:Ribosomal protein S3 [Spironucleus salmonicida]|eukprot:EST41450.1 Ribosomal protein S3 [Spironucleus salmonicida]